MAARKTSKKGAKSTKSARKSADKITRGNARKSADKGAMGAKSGTKKSGKGIKVKDVMVTDVAYVSLPGSRDNALKILKERQVSGVPVVKGGKLAGIVTRVDMLNNPEEDQLALLMRRDPITISPDASISEAARIVLENDIRRLPVVDGGKLVGMLTTADLVNAIASMGDNTPIGDLIGGYMLVVWEDMPIAVAGCALEFGHVGAAVVLNLNLGLVGLITDRDMINAAVVEDTVERSDMSSGHDEDAWSWEGMKDTMQLYYGVSRIRLPKHLLVKDVMIQQLVTAFHKSGASECAKVMSKSHFDQLPVVSAKQDLLGILRDKDLLKVLIKQ